MTDKEKNSIFNNCVISIEEIKEMLPNLSDEETFRLYLAVEIRSLKKELKNYDTYNRKEHKWFSKLIFVIYTLIVPTILSAVLSAIKLYGGK